LIARIRDADDRRRVGLAVTDEGERLLKRVRARRTTWLADRLKGLDDEELAAVEAAIEPLGRLL
jgi:DNA-binding MarR family transcriptional regulator